MIERDRSLVDVGHCEPQRLTDVVRGELWVLLEELVAGRPVGDHPNDHRDGDAGSTDARDSSRDLGVDADPLEGRGDTVRDRGSGPTGDAIGAPSRGGYAPGRNARSSVVRINSAACSSPGTRWPYWSAVVWIVA